MRSRTMQCSIVLILLLLASCAREGRAIFDAQEISKESKELGAKALKDSDKAINFAKEVYESIKDPAKKEEFDAAIKKVEASAKQLGEFKGSDSDYLAAVKKHIAQTRKLSKLTNEAVKDLEKQVKDSEKKQCDKGDVNQDKKINEEDFEFYINSWLIPEDTKVKKLCCADLNNDGKIDTKDREIFFHTFYIKEETLGKC